MHPWTEVVAAYDESLEDLEAARSAYRLACKEILGRSQAAIDLEATRERGRPDIEVGMWAEQDDGGVNIEAILPMRDAGGVLKTTIYVRRSRTEGRPSGSFEVGTRFDDDSRYRAWLASVSAMRRIQAKLVEPALIDVTSSLDELTDTVRSRVGDGLEDLMLRASESVPLRECLSALRLCEVRLRTESFAGAKLANGWQSTTYLQWNSAGGLGLWVCPQLDRRRIVYVHHANRAFPDADRAKLAAAVSAGEAFTYGGFPAHVLIDTDDLPGMDDKAIADRCFKVFCAFRDIREGKAVS